MTDKIEFSYEGKQYSADEVTAIKQLDMDTVQVRYLRGDSVEIGNASASSIAALVTAAKVKKHDADSA